MGIRSCSNCYFYEECGRPYICDSFSPLKEIEITDNEIDNYVEYERLLFYKHYWDVLVEEDRVQDYFG